VIILAEECSEGRVIGLLNPEEFPYVPTNCFAIVSKVPPDANKWRLIIDLSAPDNHLTLPLYVCGGQRCSSRGDLLFCCVSAICEGG